jgi:hypothetical protein
MYAEGLFVDYAVSTRQTSLVQRLPVPPTPFNLSSTTTPIPNDPCAKRVISVDHK